MYIAQYDISQEELEQLQKGQTPDISQKTQLIKVTDNDFIDTLFGKVSYVGIGNCVTGTDFIAGQLCGCDDHYFGELCTCPIKATEDQWIITFGECAPSGGGGGNNNSGGGSSGGSNNDDNDEIPTSPVPCPDPRGTGCIDLEDANNEPCEKLNNLLGLPINPSVKSIIQNHLQTDISNNPNGEKGAYLTKDINGNYARSILPATSTHQIGIPTAAIIPGVFCVFHTHPNITYPMFSWSDVFALYSINQDIDTHNQGLATFLLTCDVTGNGNYETYAIVFNNSTADIIDMTLNSPFYNGMDKQKIAAAKDNELAAKYVTESKNGTNNYERAFLQQMLGTNVDIYKANSSLDNWSKLKLNQFTNNVQDIPCN